MKKQLPKEFKFSYKTAMSRINRGNISASGKDSPLQKVESQFFHILLSMSKIKCSLRPNESLELINECIAGTPVQEELIQWKLKRNIYFDNLDDLGYVGKGYWRCFLNKYHHIL